MGPSRALPSVLSPNSSNVKLSDSVTENDGEMAEQAGFAKPSDESSVERIASLQLPSDLHNKPNSDTNNDFYQKNVLGGSQLHVVASSVLPRGLCRRKTFKI